MPVPREDASTLGPALSERPLLTGEQACDLGGLFKVLACDTRLRILHCLARAGRMGVVELAGCRNVAVRGLMCPTGGRKNRARCPVAVATAA